MRSFLRFLSSLLVAFVVFAPAQAESDPDVSGYVTRVGSPTDFDVAGIHVLLTPATRMESVGKTKHLPLATPAPFLGQLAMVWGKVNSKVFSVASKRVLFYETQPTVIHGSGVIDMVFPPTALYRRIRADGRILEISTDELDHPVPLAPGATDPAGRDDLRTNVWIDYHGLLRADGVVAVDRASFTGNAVSKSEGNLIKRKDYDPTAVAEDAHQSGASKFFTGTDAKQIPPYKDEFLQARVDRIAATLIPACQRALAEDDPTRIHFRFQLVDEPKWRDAWALPSGIILVPHQIVRRLPEDAQLAAILADNIATAFEKQTYRNQGTVHTMTGVAVAGDAAVAFVPLVGIAATMVAGNAQQSILTRELQQSGRVALTLMQDAGYDLRKAPEAWWILATKQGRDRRSAEPPWRARNQYMELGVAWKDATPAHVAAPPPGF